MNKKDIPKLKDNDLIEEYVSAYSSLLLNYNLNRGTKQYEGQCNAMEKELLKRGILTEDNIRRLNA
jgi:hypothetical protein